MILMRGLEQICSTKTPEASRGSALRTHIKHRRLVRLGMTVCCGRSCVPVPARHLHVSCYMSRAVRQQRDELGLMTLSRESRSKFQETRKTYEANPSRSHFRES